MNKIPTAAQRAQAQGTSVRDMESMLPKRYPVRSTPDPDRDTIRTPIAKAEVDITAMELSPEEVFFSVV